MIIKTNKKVLSLHKIYYRGKKTHNHCIINKINKEINMSTKTVSTILAAVYFTFALNSVAIAQSERLDSLLNFLPKAKEDTNETWLCK